jgi:hypothetical protein
MFLLDCPEALAVGELKFNERIEGSTSSSIKLRFQMAKFETILGLVHHPGARSGAVTSGSRSCLLEIEARQRRAQQAETSARSSRYHIRSYVRRTV